MANNRMTYEQAIYELQKDCWHRDAECDCLRTCKEDDCYIKTAIESIEKQIPKKPYRIHANIFHCGNTECDAHFTKVYDEHELFRHCPYCGQKIDWGDKYV